MGKKTKNSGLRDKSQEFGCSGGIDLQYKDASFL